MNVVTIQKDEDLIEIIKCKTDEILFARYDPKKDPEATSALMNDLMDQCGKLDVPLMVMPMSDEDVYLELEQWEVDRLRNLDNKLQEIIRKKSPLIIT